MASASAQKTDPVMEPKLKAVDWGEGSEGAPGRAGCAARGSRGGGRPEPGVAARDEDAGTRGQAPVARAPAWGGRGGW